MSLQQEGIKFIENKIREEMNIDITQLDFTTLFDGVWVVDDSGVSSLLTSDVDEMNLFKAYEDLMYGEIS